MKKWITEFWIRKRNSYSLKASCLIGSSNASWRPASMFLPVSVLSTGSVLPSKLLLSSPGGDDAIDKTQLRTNTITTKGTNGSTTMHFNWMSFVSSAAIKGHHYNASYRKVKTNIVFFLMYHVIFNSDIFKFDCKSIFTIYAKPSEQIKGSLPNYKQQCMINMLFKINYFLKTY